ncbi:hypothetical protein JCM10295v2_002730 [Rhodotorula toruloides]
MASPHLATRPPSVAPAPPQPDPSVHPPVQPTFLTQPYGFNPARRQSINSDPVLHAFSAPADASSQPLPHDSYAHPASHPRHPLANGAGGHPLHGGDGRGMDGEMDGRRGGYGQPGSEGGPGPVHFSSSFPPPGSLAPASHYPHPPLGPPANYRFGGPPPPPPPHPPQQQHDSTSYFDYSMRRHSITNSANANAHGMQQHPGAQDLPPPVPNLKRKTSGDDAEADDSYSYLPSSSYPDNQGHLVSAPPHPKRRTSSLTFDKLNSLSLAEQARRDSSYGPTSPWEDDRRGSGESYASMGSQGYSVPAYHHPQQPQPQGPMPPYDQRGPSQPYATAGGTVPPAQAWDAHPVGPRGSISRGAYEQLQQQASEPFTRRPSIPSVSQMMQGQQAFYPVQSGPPPQSAAPPPPPHPRLPFASVSRGGPVHPSVVVSSLPHTPTEMDDSRSQPYATPTSAGPHPGSQQAPWVRANAPPTHPQPTRHGSSSSLDPSSAYGPGQIPPSKETPYSRSPELRVSHKLAERKRRKEMAQLFEDLRESLPFDRALKASKWEILSKAIEYVGTLKSHCHELATENRSMREHYNLPPSSVEEPPGLGSAGDHFRHELDGSATSTVRGAQSPSPEANPAPNSLANGTASPFPPSSDSSSSHNLTPVPPAPRPRSQASQGQVQWRQHRQYPPTGSPMQGPLQLKMGDVVAPNGGLPQPSPPLSQHSSNASGSPVVGASAPIDPLDHATSPVVTNAVAA